MVDHDRDLKVVCWYCKKERHLKKVCFALNNKFGREEQGEAAVITKQLQYSDALNVSDQNPRNNWVIDSWRTYHMASRRN